MNKDILNNLEKNFGKCPELYCDNLTFMYNNCNLIIPANRLIEIYGESSTGKTSLALSLLAKIDAPAMYIDAEFSFDTAHAKQLGCNLENLVIAKTNKISEIKQAIAQSVIEIGVDTIIIDSLAAIEFNRFGELQDFVIELASMASKNHLSIWVINQLRNKKLFSSALGSFGSNKMKFYYSMRIYTKKCNIYAVGNIGSSKINNRVFIEAEIVKSINQTKDKIITIELPYES